MLYSPQVQVLLNYELRWHAGHVQYRILYTFHGRGTVVLLHAITKEGKVPSMDIARAIRRLQLFAHNPNRYTKP